jgi:hypothetical protein
VGLTDEWIADWGLVELAQEKVPSVDNLSSVSLYLWNINSIFFSHGLQALSSKVINELRSRYKGTSLTNLGGIVSLEELAARSSGGLDDSHKHTVFNCGRTTGKTRAVLNSIDSSVQMSYVDKVSIVGRTLVVLSPPKTKQTWRGPCGGFIVFGTKGDSGSLVFDYRGKVLGTYFGG